METDAQVSLRMGSFLQRLRETMESAVARNPAEAVLLSGGLDTSIVAALSSRQGSQTAYTVALEGSISPDLEYARLMETHLGSKHKVHFFEIDELIKILPGVIETLRVFDPMEIRNSAAVYIGLRQASDDGNSTVLTGDGCDELFAGYSFFFNLEPNALKAALRKMWEAMSFSAIPMGESLGMEAKIPFLDPEVRELADEIEPSLLVVERNGQKWGKWIVRKAFEDLLPSEVTWRVKTPIEYGCGTTMLPQIFEEKISDNEFSEKYRLIKERDGVSIRDKEQLAYYEIFREMMGERPMTQGRTCPQCRFEVRTDATFCRTCGAYPI